MVTPSNKVRESEKKYIVYRLLKLLPAELDILVMEPVLVLELDWNNGLFCLF